MATQFKQPRHVHVVLRMSLCFSAEMNRHAWTNTEGRPAGAMHSIGKALLHPRGADAFNLRLKGL
jgi:hypothetical protein